MRISGGGPKLNIRATVSVQTPGIEAFTSGITYALGNLALAARGRSSLSAQLGNNANRPPVWSGFPQTLVVFQGGGAINLSSYCTDPDGDPVTYRSIGAALPAGVTLTSQGMLSAASDAAIGTTATCIFEASDGRGGIANSPSFTLAVQAPSAVPLLEVDLAYATAIRFRGSGDTATQKTKVSASWATMWRSSDDKAFTWGGESHGQFESNSIRMFDPILKTHVEITNDTALVPGTNTTANWNQPASLWYNNMNHMVIPSTDDLVIFGRNFGNIALMRSMSPAQASTDGWTHFQPTVAGFPDGTYWTNQANSGNVLPRTVGTEDGSFFLATAGVTPAVLGGFNGGLAWSRFLDKGVLIGPIAQGGVHPYVYVFERNDASSRFYDPTKPNCKWVAWRDDGSQPRWSVGDKWPIRDLSSEIRNMCCAVGDWIYFISPKGTGNAFDPGKSFGWFWKFNLRTLSETGDPQLQQCATMYDDFWKVHAITTSLPIKGSLRLTLDGANTSGRIAGYSPPSWWAFINDIVVTQDPTSVGFGGSNRICTFLVSRTNGHKYIFEKRAITPPGGTQPTRSYRGIIHRMTNYGGDYAAAPDPLPDDTYDFEDALGAPLDFGQMVYDESAGYILYLGSKGVWCYDPLDDAKGWMRSFEATQPDKNNVVPYNNNPPAFVSQMQGVYLPSHGMTVARQGGGLLNTDKWMTIKILTKKSRQTAQHWRAHWPNQGAYGEAAAQRPRENAIQQWLWGNKHGRFCWDETKGYLYKIGGDHQGWPWSSDVNASIIGVPGPITKVGADTALRHWAQSDGARQDFWMTTGEKDSQGRVWWELCQNAFSNFPYAPNNPSFPRPQERMTWSALGDVPILYQPGPISPDGIAATIDKRGDVWCGIGGRSATEYAVDPHPSVLALDPVGYRISGWANEYLMRWRLPDIDPVTKVRLGGGENGKGYWVPPQNFLMSDARADPRISLDEYTYRPIFNPDRLGPGIGDFNALVRQTENSYMTYDPVGDELIVITQVGGVGMANTAMFKCGVGPTRIAGPNGEYLWRRYNLTPRVSADAVNDAFVPGYKGIPYPPGVTTINPVTNTSKASYGQPVIVDRKVYWSTFVYAYTPNTYQYRTNGATTPQNFTNFVGRFFLCWCDLDNPTEMHFIHAIGVAPYKAIEIIDPSNGEIRLADNESNPQNTHLYVINRKIVLTPPEHSQGGSRPYVDGDPMLYTYDVDSKKWQAGEPFNTSLTATGRLNTSWGMFAAMPHLSEIWFINPNPVTPGATYVPHIRYRID